MNKKLLVSLCIGVPAVWTALSFSIDRISPPDDPISEKKIWIDADLAVGMKRIGRPGYSDVDDAYAVLQLLKSDAVDIIGMSAVFGNTSLENADSLLRVMVQKFPERPIPVFRGASQAIDLRNVESNPAVEALAKSLQAQEMTVLAIGPATNIGLLLLKYPELSHRIKEVVLVAGRRSSTDYFEIGNKGRRAPDLNFDLDNLAFQLLFQHEVPVTLCPFEISNKVWIGKKQLDQLAAGDQHTAWLSGHSQPWLQQWIDQGETGFNPFDVLASHYLIAADEIVYEPLKAHLEIHPNDMVSETQKNSFKQYLVCDTTAGYPVRYCYDVAPGFGEQLMITLLK